MTKRRKNVDSKGVEELSAAFKDSAEVEGLKLEIKRVNALVEAQNKMIDQLATEIQKKDDYIAEIQGSGLEFSSKMSDEEIIARKELERLKQKAILGELSLDDTRKYDLLVKNKHTAITKTPIDVSYKSLPAPDEQKLIELATKTIKKVKSE